MITRYLLPLPKLKSPGVAYHVGSCPPFLHQLSYHHRRPAKLRPSFWAPPPLPRSRPCGLAIASSDFCQVFGPGDAVGMTQSAASPPTTRLGSNLMTHGVKSPPLASALMIKTIIPLLFVGFLAWILQPIRPPPPRICGSPGGPPITGPRIKLRDGRHLAYKEHGVSKELARYKVVLVHGFGSSRHEAEIATAEAVQELGIYFVSFDRPGYGESDPDPKRSFRSLALDIEELADQLELRSKFYVIGFSMGGQVVWGCLKYISHRVAGAALVCPVINYWWPGFPSNLSTEAYYQQLPQDQWALRVAHYTPWLTYWWNTQKLFPSSSVISGRPKLSRRDLEIISKLADRQSQTEYVTQQGEFESFHRDMIVGFGKVEFDPMDLKNPFADAEGSVHLWHGDEDGLVPVVLQRYIAEKLPWIRYHEIPNAGHLLVLDNKEAILKELFTV
ncbi:uncharacterized protein [Coffea arabica]|uniref:Uncharacterized protein isoform X2 n=1 Tax=Coffea arabica TaxID=13443 RepID=A0A6P6W7T5_COFAR|nr:uncharacterized protein LOC113730675 isoform X2 [Coffea arabica]